MESEVEKSKKEDGSDSVFDESVTESRESSRWSWNSGSSSDFSSPSQSAMLIGKPLNFSENDVSDVKYKSLLNSKSVVEGHQSKLHKHGSKVSELEMMKEKFSKLLLGEDMSGSGKGVCSALAISNAITNLYATVFGQLWRLEPLPSEKKAMWLREMEWLLCVSDHIVEMLPSWQTLPGGVKVEVMSSRPRLDLAMNLPALRKLDNMLVEILDEFTDSEFWYVDQEASEAVKTVSFRKAVQRQEDKWWLPVPRVPPGGLSDSTRKRLRQKLECASQILKAASAINSSALAEMDVPESYLETLPKNGKSCLGDIMYRCITSEHFSPDVLLDCLDLSPDHAAVDLANRVESAIYVWIKRLRPKHSNHSSIMSSWDMVRDRMVEGDKHGLLVVRAENLLETLKRRFPGLEQTTLDACKIQCNKDIGKSILESYSRVLEGLAFSIVSRIENLLFVDGSKKQSDKLSSQKAHAPLLVPVSGPSYHKLEKVKDSIHVVEGLGPRSVLRGTNEGTPSHPSMGSSSVDSETRPQAEAVDRYFMYSTLR